MFDARSRLLLIIATLVSVGSACGAEIGVPEDVHVPIFLKILTYDRALRRNSTDQIRIGIIHSPGNRDSQRNGRRVQESLSANSEKTINGLTFNFTSMPFTSPADLDSSLSHGNFSVLYITCGNSANLKAITTISRKHRCLTITGVAEYVHAELVKAQEELKIGYERFRDIAFSMSDWISFPISRSLYPGTHRHAYGRDERRDAGPRNQGRSRHRRHCAGTDDRDVPGRRCTQAEGNRLYRPSDETGPPIPAIQCLGGSDGQAIGSPARRPRRPPRGQLGGMSAHGGKW